MNTDEPTAEEVENAISVAMWDAFPPVKFTEEGVEYHQVEIPISQFNAEQREVLAKIIYGLPPQHVRFLSIDDGETKITARSLALEDNDLRRACDAVMQVVPENDKMSRNPTIFVNFLQKTTQTMNRVINSLMARQDELVATEVEGTRRCYLGNISPMTTLEAKVISSFVKREDPIAASTLKCLRECYVDLFKTTASLCHFAGPLAAAEHAINAERLNCALDRPTVTSFTESRTKIIKTIREYRRFQQRNGVERHEPVVGSAKDHRVRSQACHAYFMLLMTSQIDPDQRNMAPNSDAAGSFISTFHDKFNFDVDDHTDLHGLYCQIMAHAEAWRSSLCKMDHHEAGRLMASALVSAMAVHGGDLFTVVRSILGISQSDPIDPWALLLGHLSAHEWTMCLLEDEVTESPKYGYKIEEGIDSKIDELIELMPSLSVDVLGITPHRCYSTVVNGGVGGLLNDDRISAVLLPYSPNQALDAASRRLQGLAPPAKPNAEEAVVQSDAAYAEALEEPRVPNPREIAKNLGSMVLGQPEAVKALALHLHAGMNRQRRGPLLLIGPTGSGKSALMAHAGKVANRPVVSINGAGLVAPGIVGVNISSAIVNAAKSLGDDDFTDQLIIFIDEFDKIYSSHYGQSVIFTLLKMIDGEDLRADECQNTNRRADREFSINSKNFIWVFAGSWSKLRTGNEGDGSTECGVMGFHNSSATTQKAAEKLLELKDLDIPIELRGRISSLVELHPHDRESITEVMKSKEVSPWNIVTKAIHGGVVPSSELLAKIVDLAVSSGYGVRGLQKICQKIADEISWNGYESNEGEEHIVSANIMEWIKL